MIGGIFLLATMNKRTGEKVFKARYMLSGHMDRKKDVLLHPSSTVS